VKLNKIWRTSHQFLAWTLFCRRYRFWLMEMSSSVTISKQLLNGLWKLVSSTSKVWVCSTKDIASALVFQPRLRSLPSRCQEKLVKQCILYISNQPQYHWTVYLSFLLQFQTEIFRFIAGQFLLGFYRPIPCGRGTVVSIVYCRCTYWCPETNSWKHNLTLFTILCCGILLWAQVRTVIHTSWSWC